MKMNNKERITALLLTAAIIIGGAGCGNKKIDAVNTTPPAVSTSAATATPTETNAELAMAPDITGLTKQIQNDKVVYVAKEGNGYGLEANSYAGQFKKEVTVEGTETGGVALVPKVAEKLLTDAIAKIPEGQDKFRIIPPLDISNVDSSETISINPAMYPEMNLNVLIIDYNGKIPLVSVQPGKNHFNTGPGSIPLSFKEKNKEVTIQSVEATAPVISTNAYYSEYIFSREFTPTNSSADLNFGDSLGLEVGSPLILTTISSILKPKIIPVNISDLLTVDNHPVFIVANSTSGT